MGLRTGHLKSGAPCRGERVAKYNRLMDIEAELQGQWRDLPVCWHSVSGGTHGINKTFSQQRYIRNFQMMYWNEVCVYSKTALILGYFSCQPLFWVSSKQHCRFFQAFMFKAIWMSVSAYVVYNGPHHRTPTPAVSISSLIPFFKGCSAHLNANADKMCPWATQRIFLGLPVAVPSVSFDRALRRCFISSISLSSLSETWFGVLNDKVALLALQAWDLLVLIIRSSYSPFSHPSLQIFHGRCWSRFLEFLSFRTSATVNPS